VGGASIGALLRERREALGATLAEVEAATKIRQKYLSALEADEWQSLPGEVVGRGFLRNYAGYLGIEPTEIIERRRIAADPTLSSALAATSAGSTLPPVRAVDYRPKDVDLREEPDTLEERPPLRLMPILLVVAALAVVGGLWWGFTRMGDGALGNIAAAGSGLTDRVGAFFASDDPTATPAMAVLAGGASRAGAESSLTRAPCWPKGETTPWAQVAPSLHRPAL
jgi:transcriptional regulator with XRE-family HTH domain